MVSRGDIYDGDPNWVIKMVMLDASNALESTILGGIGNLRG